MCCSSSPVPPLLTAPSAAQPTLCASFCIADIEPVDQNTTIITVEATNRCQRAVSYIAIGIEGGTHISPPDGSVYTSPSGETYLVEWTDGGRDFNFDAIKFTPRSKRGTYKDGAADLFEITVQGFSSGSRFNFQMHFGGSRSVTFTGMSAADTCPEP